MKRMGIHCSACAGCSGGMDFIHPAGKSPPDHPVHASFAFQSNNRNRQHPFNRKRFTMNEKNMFYALAYGLMIVVMAFFNDGEKKQIVLKKEKEKKTKKEHVIEASAAEKPKGNKHQS